MLAKILRPAVAVLILLVLVGCDRQRSHTPPKTPATHPQTASSAPVRDSAATRSRPVPKPPASAAPEREFRVVHVFVALCDNEHQGIVKVRPALGNGQNPRTNLYWGAMYGVKTFLTRSGHWRRLGVWRAPAGQAVLERTVFEGRFGGQRVYLAAEAYDGAHMEAALRAFFLASAGRARRTWSVPGLAALPVGGSADMVCFVGHNGLMDTRTEPPPRRGTSGGPKCAVVLACSSAPYFTPPLRRAGCPLLLATRSSMAPEAYTLDAIIRAWSQSLGDNAIHAAAANAYAKYQRCSLPAARRLFVTHPTE